VIVVAALALSACGGAASSANHSPTVSGQPISTANSTPSGSAAPSSSPGSTAGGTSLVHCTTAVPAGDNLVIGALNGDPTVVVRDIQDPANAKNLCTFDAAAASPRFVSATQVAYETASNELIKADLSSGSTSLIATFGAGLGSGQYSVSPDGRSFTYLDGNAWHLVSASGNRILTTLPAVPGRGVNPDEDDIFLSYSPDGLYIALVQTFHTGGTGATAPDQVRKAGDGSLVYSTTGMTMGGWASVPSRLFFRDAGGTVHRWDSSTGLSTMLALHWIGPKASPDGRWIGYTFRTSGGIGGVGFYSVQSNSISNTSPPGRSGVRFLTNDLVWYGGEKACSTCLGGQPTPTGVTYIYDIAGTSEVVSRLSNVYDNWPHSTPAGL
jgi:hypothetical protein